MLFQLVAPVEEGSRARAWHFRIDRAIERERLGRGDSAVGTNLTSNW